MSRILAPALQPQLGQTVIVENKGGAGGAALADRRSRICGAVPGHAEWRRCWRFLSTVEFVL